MQHNLKRTFIAVKILPEDPFMSEYASIRNQLKHEMIRWVEPENFHITIHFLGDTHESELGKIPDMLEKAIKNMLPFRFCVTGMDVFRSMRHPRVLWLGISQTHDLCRLKGRVDESLESLLKERKNNTFNPHLTLGRMKHIQDRDALGRIIHDYREYTFQKVQISKLLFLESVISREGASYTVISEHSFC